MYDINDKTVFIIYVDKKKSLIVEIDNSFYVDRNATNIIIYNCYNYGSSLDGRCYATKKILGINYKVPIIVDELRKIIFFPTSSLSLKNSSWICFNNVSKINKNGSKSNIFYDVDKLYEFDFSYQLMLNQYSRAAMLFNYLIRRCSVLLLFFCMLIYF